jgi:small subunit ribosomal protein S8
MTDPISDFLTRIRNAQLASQPEVELPYSKLKYAVAQVLEREGWIAGLATADHQATLKVVLKYDEGQPIIRSLKRISKPGRRVYVNRHELPRVLGGMGTAIVSTSKGVMTSTEAREAKLGGEILCEIS